MLDPEDIEHLENFISEMNLRRHDEKTCDFTLTVEGKTIRAHKFVLAAGSPYFRAMITNDFKESIESKVVIQQIAFEIVQQVVDYLYTLKIDITNQNAGLLLEAALIMQIASIQHKCISHLVKILDSSNCVDVLIIGNKFKIEKLTYEAADYIICNFNDVDEKQIALLSFQQMLGFVKNTGLVAESEYAVFLAVKKWVTHNNKEEHLADLFEQIRLPTMNVLNLGKVASDPIVLSNQRCQEYVNKVKNYLLFPRVISDMNNKRSFYARGYSDTKIYYFGGGSPTMEYSPRETYAYWLRTNMATIRNIRFAITVWNNVIYFAGGTEDGEISKYVGCYNFLSNMTTHMTPLISAREAPGIAIIEGSPYIIGGRTTRGVIAETAELYQPLTDEWIECQGPNEARFASGVATLGDRIYVIGGRTIKVEEGTSKYRATKAVERLQRLNQWQYVSSMITARAYPGCATFKGQIYIAGGMNLGQNLCSCEKYDPGQDKWEPIASMTESRHGLSLVVLGQLIFAVGGCTADGFSDKVESYDPVKNEWTTRQPQRFNYQGGAVAIKGLLVYRS